MAARPGHASLECINGDWSRQSATDAGGKFADFGDEYVLRPRRKTDAAEALCLVAAFGKQAGRWQITIIVVGISRQPEPVRPERFLQQTDVIDDDLAREGDQCQVAAKLPHRDGGRIVIAQLFPLVQSREESLGSRGCVAIR